MSSGQVEEQPAAADHVQLLHAQPDAQHGHPPLLHQLADQAIRQLAPLGDERDRRVRRQPHLAGIQVVAARQHHAVQPIEDRREVRLPRQRRDDDRQGVGRQEALEIAAVDEAVRCPALGRGAVVRVDPDEWTILHGSHPFLEMVSIPKSASDDRAGRASENLRRLRHLAHPGWYRGAAGTDVIPGPVSLPVLGDSDVAGLDVRSVAPPVRGGPLRGSSLCAMSKVGDRIRLIRQSPRRGGRGRLRVYRRRRADFKENPGRIPHFSAMAGGRSDREAK